MGELITKVRALLAKAVVAEPTKLRKGEAVSLIATKFGGLPYAERGDEWPVCGGCGEGLSFIFQANLAECAAAERGKGLFAFFYCHSCSSWGDIPPELTDAWVVRRYEAPSEAKAIEMEDTSPEDARTRACSVKLATVMSLPDWEGVGEIAPEVSDMSAELNDDEPWEPYVSAAAELLGEHPDNDDFRTQIGGYAKFVQGAVIPECAKCNHAMRLLAQIDSADEAGLMWGDAGCVYLWECERHPQGELVQMRLQCF